MEEKQLQHLKKWFNDYVAVFYSSDDYMNANLKLKEEHTWRVCSQVQFLADKLNLDRNQRRLADAIAILHDVGRFRQFASYRTYVDTRSINHCELAVNIIREEKLLDDLQKRERHLIEKAVEYHGLKEIPNGLTDELLLHCRLIRDADKLDIFYVVTTYYRRYNNDPDDFNLEVEFPDKPYCTGKVVEEILAGQRVDYSELQTLNDVKLLQLGWIYDVNFPATLKRIKKSGFLEEIADQLPKTERVLKAKNKIFSYFESKIKNNGEY